MKKLVAVSTIALASLALHALPVHALEGRGMPPEPDFVPGEIIVKMKPRQSLSGDDLNAFSLHAADQLTSGGEIIYRIESSVLSTMSAAQAKDQTLTVVEDLKKRPDVEYAQPNYILYAMKTPNDPLYAKQWHYFNNGSGTGESPGGIDLPKAWDASTGGNVVVAVIDTGIVKTHEDIVGSPNLVDGYDMISDVTRANDGDGRDGDPSDPGDGMAAGECGFGQPPQAQPNSWHGTHVAGTIGVGKTDNNLGIAGINWTVKVQAVRVLGKCGGSTSDINDAIRWAAGLTVPGVPANATPSKVINMSLGGGSRCLLSPAMQSAINDAVAKGVTVVVAAGNDGKDASGYSPAGCNNVITVAAADPRGALTPWSNFGTTVEILAPGGLHKSCSLPQDGILSTVGNDNSGACALGTGYSYYNGTSMAAPHVAGVAALWIAQDPALTPATLVTELQKAVYPRDSSQCPQPCGAGLLSALRTPKGGTPPPGGVRVVLDLDPDKSSYNVGETITAKASVQLNGAPQPGTSVAFGSDNSSVASVSPTSAVTNNAGQAQTTVSAKAAGQTAVSAEAGGNQVKRSISVQQVPDFSTTGMVMLLAGIIAIGLFHGRRVAT
jgi:serine protease